MLQHPCPGARRTNPFGSRTVDYSAFGLTAHNGEDFAGCDAARAMATGVVERVGNDPAGYGIYVTLRHDWQGGQHYRTRYAHLARAYVREGDILQQGDALGQVGATGNTTGPHLHAEFEPGLVTADGLKGRRAFWHMLEGGA